MNDDDLFWLFNDGDCEIKIHHDVNSLLIDICNLSSLEAGGLHIIMVMHKECQY